MHLLQKVLKCAWLLSLGACQTEKAATMERIPGLRVLRINGPDSIVIYRDRDHLLGLGGAASEEVRTGGVFTLRDADHVQLDYRFAGLEGSLVRLEERDRSQLLLEPRRDKRRMIVVSSTPWADTLQDARDVALHLAGQDPTGVFGTPHVAIIERQASTGHWRVRLLSRKPTPGALDEHYWDVVVDKASGRVLFSERGGGS